MVGDFNISQYGLYDYIWNIHKIGSERRNVCNKLLVKTLKEFNIQQNSTSYKFCEGNNFLDCCFATPDITVRCQISPNLFFPVIFNHKYHKTNIYSIN